MDCKKVKLNYFSFLNFVISVFLIFSFLIALVHKRLIYYPSLNYSFTNSNDSYFSDQWAIQKVELDKAWDIYTGSSNVTVGVIDSGIDVSHYDLSNNIDTTLSTSLNPDLLSGLDDNNGHGTHVAGIIGALGNNGYGICGSCWDVNIASLRVASTYGTGPSETALLNSFEYAENNQIQFLNISLGKYAFPFSDIDYFSNAFSSYNGLSICAAGNGNELEQEQGINLDDNSFNAKFYPACFLGPNIISVGASNKTDGKYGDSNYGRFSVDLFAPGEDIKSTFPNNNFVSYSGTSMATPLVTGTAALLKSIDPSLTLFQIKSAILNNVDVVDSLYNLCLSHGRLNAYQAALSILPSIVANDTGITFNSNINYQKFLKMNLFSGHYTLLINNSIPCRVTLYRRYIDTPLIQQSFTTSGAQTINFLSETNQTVYIRVENLSNSNGNISISAAFQNHLYNNSYAFQGPLFHRAYCNCGDYVLLPHIIYVPNEWATYGTCAVCGAIVPVGGEIILSIDNPSMNNTLSVFDLLGKPVVECF